MLPTDAPAPWCLVPTKMLHEEKIVLMASPAIIINFFIIYYLIILNNIKKTIPCCKSMNLAVFRGNTYPY
jgi:hypothetical protein